MSKRWATRSRETSCGLPCLFENCHQMHQHLNQGHCAHLRARTARSLRRNEKEFIRILGHEEKRDVRNPDDLDSAVPGHTDNPEVAEGVSRATSELTDQYVGSQRHAPGAQRIARYTQNAPGPEAFGRLRRRWRERLGRALAGHEHPACCRERCHRAWRRGAIDVAVQFGQIAERFPPKPL